MIYQWMLENVFLVFFLLIGGCGFFGFLAFCNLVNSLLFKGGDDADENMFLFSVISVQCFLFLLTIIMMGAYGNVK